MLAIGKKMRELRQRKGWTLAQLAKGCGIALSSLSRIETGRMTGTLESHLRIAKALGVRLVELYADVEPAASSIEHRRGSASLSEEFLTSKGVAVTLLTVGSLRKKMLPALLSVPPGKATQSEHAAVGTERFLYLLKGKLRVAVGKEEFSLQPGDSLYFQASLSHSLKNAGTGPLVALSITSPPSL